MRPLTPSISTPGAARETPEDWRGCFFLNPIIHHSIVETSLSFGFRLPAELSRISIAEDKTVFEFWVWSTTPISLNKWRHLGGNSRLGPRGFFSTPKIYINCRCVNQFWSPLQIDPMPPISNIYQYPHVSPNFLPKPWIYAFWVTLPPFAWCVGWCCP